MESGACAAGAAIADKTSAVDSAATDNTPTVRSAKGDATPFMLLSSCRSKIRLGRSRDLSVPFRAVLVRIFGADAFVPEGDLGTVGHGRGPGRGEDPFILDGEFELQVLALVVGIDRVELDLEILLRVPVQA